jgi:crossover junction endodeoxyribonuclease RuvC
MKTKPRRILGIDPGYDRLGWAVIGAAGPRLQLVSSGCISVKPRDPSERLMKLYDELSVVLRHWHPTEASMERLFMNHNVTTAIGVGQARGVVLLALAQTQLPVREFTPSQIKSAATGYGRADKAQIQHMMQLLLGLDRPPRSDDEADAMAVAICAANKHPNYAS